MNKLLGRPVNNLWWSTKLEHIITLPLPLALVDIAVGTILLKGVNWYNAYKTKKLGLPLPELVTKLSWKKYPGTVLTHVWLFSIIGVMFYADW